MSIWQFLIIIFKKSKVVPAILTTIIVIFALAYMIFQQSLLMQSDLDIYSTIIALVWYVAIERLLKTINELIVLYFIMLPFKLTATKHLSEVIANRSPSSLLLMKENPYVLKNAALKALQSLVENSLSIITPIVLLISRGVAISMHLNCIQLFEIIVCLASVFFTGSAILAYDHSIKEKLSKKETIVEEQARSLMTSVITIVINGMASMLPNWMETLKKDEAIPSTKHDVIITIMYGVLEIATTVIPIALVWGLKEKDAFLPFYIIIQPMFWNSWYLFLTVKYLVVSTATWVQFAEFMNNSNSLPTNLVFPTSAAEMMTIFRNSKLNEIRLIGDSGCGKSSLMKKLIAQICDKFALGFILYIDQFAFIQQGISLRQYFASAFTNPTNLPDDFIQKLFEYAESLGLSNVVNEYKIEMPFMNPSGGETKRIIFLRYILPILMGVSSVQIMFLDEVSAGLDKASFIKVRSLLELVKNKGVKVVSIDHHDYPTDLCVEVYKKIVLSTTPQSDKKNSSLLQRMIYKIFPFAYQKKEQTELEICERNTDIIVWAPELGIKEPFEI